MIEKPLSPELSPQEIEQLQKTLESSSTVKRLEATQTAILNILEKDREIQKYRSNFRKRDQIKAIDSVIEKINDHRRGGETYYDSVCLKDLIGAQMICPYPDDIQAVIDWLYSPKGGRKYFKIVDSKRDIEKKRQEREDKTGYRAYHICLKLKENIAKALSLPHGSENEKFELQIKTALDAGWDFKTHDITYKAFDADPDLQHHMKLISESLGSIDEQTLLLRNWIIDEQYIRRELREAACRLIFYITLKDSQKKKLGIEKIDIKEQQQSVIGQLESVLGKYRRSNGVDRTYTLGLALVALCCSNWFKQEQALSCASHLLKQAEEKNNKKEYNSSLRIRALLRWAFHKTRHAVDDMQYLMNITKKPRDINDYVYYVSELYEPTENDMQLAKDCLRKIESIGGAEYMDTIGAYYIRFGENVEKLRYGLDLVRQAKEKAQGSHLEPVLTAFCSYHEYLFLR